MNIFKNIFRNQKTVATISGVFVLLLTLSIFQLSYFSSNPKTNDNVLPNSVVEKSLPENESYTNSSSLPTATNSPTVSPTKSASIISKVISGTVKNNNVTIKSVNSSKKLPKFKSYQEILDLLKKMGVSYSGAYRGGVMLDGVLVAPGEKAGNEAPTANASGQGGFSSTNTQVSGIDEGDIIKNDGKYLYIANQNKVSIMDVYPAAGMKKISEIIVDKNEFVQELYLKDDLLTIICSSYENNPVPTNPTDTPSQSSETSGKSLSSTTADAKMVAPDYWYLQKQLTVIKVYNVNNKELPSLTRTLKFDGNLISSREKDGKFYVITNRNIQAFPEKDVNADDILPAYSDTVKGKQEILIPAQNIEYCPENVSANYLLISCFDITTQEPVVVETVLGAGNSIYMSNTALYIMQPFYRYSIKPMPAESTIVETSKNSESSASIASTGTASVPVASVDVASVQEGTVIMKFMITASGVQFNRAGEVPGQIINQYSVDEYLKTFRIATTSWGSDGSTNNIFTLSENLDILGKVTNLAPGERIYAVRFVEETGYVVTFRNMDPLFVIDLSNPSAPKVVGELKIPGFSNYLHPVSSTLLIGIGQNTKTVYKKDESGKDIAVGSTLSGLKVSLFDVSDPQSPKELDSIAIGGVGSNSEAQYNPRAFVWWKAKLSALFPVYLVGGDGGLIYDGNNINAKMGAMLISVSGKSLIEKGRLLPADVADGYYGQSRVAYINNVIYISMNMKVIAFDATTMQEISRTTT